MSTTKSTIRNAHGIEIRCACISCKYYDPNASIEEAKQYGSKALCRWDNTPAVRNELCGAWECKPALLNVGADPTGKVHSPEYTTFVRAHLDEYNELFEAYEKEYTEKYGNDRSFFDFPDTVTWLDQKWRETYGNRNKYMNI